MIKSISLDLGDGHWIDAKYDGATTIKLTIGHTGIEKQEVTIPLEAWEMICGFLVVEGAAGG